MDDKPKFIAKSKKTETKAIVVSNKPISNSPSIPDVLAHGDAKPMRRHLPW